MSLFLTLTLGLLILPILWFITDPRLFKERLEQYLTLKGIIVTLIELVLIYFNFHYPNTLSLGSIFLPIGIFLYSIGLFIAIWAKVTMGEFWGRPATHNLKRQNRLITYGPFQYSRNPIYLGLILTFLGYSLVLRSIFIVLNLFVIVYFYYAAIKEENILEKHFGKEYKEYRSRVRRFI